MMPITTEARTTVTATSRAKTGQPRPQNWLSGSSARLRRTTVTARVLGALAAMLLGGCSSHAQDRTPVLAPAGTTTFAWFQAGPAPAGWKSRELPDGTAVLSIPPGASPVESDPGSLSAALTAPNGDLQVYLNATPQQGEESLTNWPEFRLDHLTGEHAASATRISSRDGMAFRGGTGSCVADAYVSRIGAHEYREIACLVEGTRGSSVLVVAALAGSWDRYGPVMQQAIDSYLAE